MVVYGSVRHQNNIIWTEASEAVYGPVHTFSECAGLKVNLDKPKAIWLGSRRGCHEQLLPDKQLL
jgi:hypothetical protein